MKAKLIFNLDEPENRLPFEIAVKGMDIVCAISDFDEYLRSKLKYETIPLDSATAYQDARDKLWEYLNEFKHLING